MCWLAYVLPCLVTDEAGVRGAKTFLAFVLMFAFLFSFFCFFLAMCAVCWLAYYVKNARCCLQAPTTWVCVRAGLNYLRSDGRTKKGANFSNIRVFAKYPLRLGWRVGWDNMYVSIKVLEQSNVSQSKANPSREKSAKKKWPKKRTRVFHQYFLVF